jgi:hypothetical protein
MLSFHHLLLPLLLPCRYCWNRAAPTSYDWVGLPPAASAIHVDAAQQPQRQHAQQTVNVRHGLWLRL